MQYEYWLANIGLDSAEIEPNDGSQTKEPRRGDPKCRSQGAWRTPTLQVYGTRCRRALHCRDLFRLLIPNGLGPRVSESRPVVLPPLICCAQLYRSSFSLVLLYGILIILYHITVLNKQFNILLAANIDDLFGSLDCVNYCSTPYFPVHSEVPNASMESTFSFPYFDVNGVVGFWRTVW